MPGYDKEKALKIQEQQLKDNFVLIMHIVEKAPQKGWFKFYSWGEGQILFP